MNFEFEKVKDCRSWPATTDMTRSDTYPNHVNFEMTATEKDARIAELACMGVLKSVEVSL